MKILCVEDEPELAGHIAKALTRAGHAVECADDGLKATAKAVDGGYDLVVLDVNLPGCDGFEVVRRMRSAKLPTWVLMLTARADLPDRITGLEAGADDYVTKPFAMEELVARVAAFQRRAGMTDKPDVLKAADIVFNLRSRKVMRGKEEIFLSPREQALLQIFFQEPGRIFSRDEICERIWNREHEYDTRTVEIYIMRLRKKIDEGRDEPLIETLRGIGYRLRPE